MLLEQLDIFTSCGVTFLISVMLFCLTAEILHVAFIGHRSSYMLCVCTSICTNICISICTSICTYATDSHFIVLFQMPTKLEVVCSLHVYMYIQNTLDILMVHLHI